MGRLTKMAKLSKLLLLSGIAVGQPVNEWEQLPGTDCPNSDIRMTNDANTIEECIAFCDGTYGCDALTFLQAHEKKACFCKSGGCENTSNFPNEPWAKGAISARKSSQVELEPAGFDHAYRALQAEIAKKNARIDRLEGSEKALREKMGEMQKNFVDQQKLMSEINHETIDDLLAEIKTLQGEFEALDDKYVDTLGKLRECENPAPFEELE